MAKKLKEQIAVEIENLKRLTDEMGHLLTNSGEKKNFMEVRAAGSILHDFYCGIEKVFERVAVAVDKNLPEGEDWHKELLFQMARPLEGIRDKVISEDLMQKFQAHIRV